MSRAISPLRVQIIQSSSGWRNHSDIGNPPVLPHQSPTFHRVMFDVYHLCHSIVTATLSMHPLINISAH